MGIGKVGVRGSNGARLFVHQVGEPPHRAADTFGQNNTSIIRGRQKNRVQQILHCHCLPGPEVELGCRYPGRGLGDLQPLVKFSSALQGNNGGNNFGRTCRRQPEVGLLLV